MDNICCVFGGEDEQMDLPAGFRFHPTDEELITYYLSPKVLNSNFSARAIGEVDLNKCEPWDLPKRAKMGEKEWYFYCVRDRKYPTGLRTNRATEAGYWKATGKDKEIYREKALVGMKKTLVFYKGRAPKGEKSNWVMHEYRLEAKNHPTSAKNEWVICRVFEKNSSGKKIPFPGLMRSEAAELPPLMDSSPSLSLSHVPCFSNTMIAQENLGGFGATNTNQYPQPQGYYPEAAHHINPFRSNQLQQYPIPIPIPIPYGRYGAYNYNENEVLRSILGNGSNGGTEDKQGMMKTEGVTFSVSQDASLSTTEMNAEISSVVSNYDLGRAPFHDFHEAPSASGGPVDIDSLLDYRSSGNWS